ncbi:MAG: galactokinase [Lentisphaerae bacterium GWF2_44_16]|nr:MAG: galactokinase [Lentisphaerae bacterium GWF2_44_16]
MNKNIRELFQEEYGKKPSAVSRAPGRLEVLGNHTDYNEGLVLSAAIEQATEFAIAAVSGNLCKVRDFRDGSKIEFELDKIETPVRGNWGNYIKGVIMELRKRGHETGAFEGAILSDVPLSAGMSSSAALEVATAFALGEAFGIKLSGEEWARIGQAAENNYSGVKCGLLDQFSSIFGKKDSFILCDFRKTEVLRTVPVPHGYVLVVANSLVKHNLVDSDYNIRRESCEKAVQILQEKHPEIKALRDVTPALLRKSKEFLPLQDYLRARHIVGENDRVMKAVEALDKGMIEKFGALLFESHKSSRENFENSCIELDCLVELAFSIPGAWGARLSGGGFGGITIHLVKSDDAKAYSERLKTAYKLQTGKEIETITCGIGDGASVSRIL